LDTRLLKLEIFSVKKELICRTRLEITFEFELEMFFPHYAKKK
jgi:hypothetical protein